MLVENVSNVIKEWPTFPVWWKQLSILIKSNSFQEWIFGQAKWACLSHRSLEGGTRVQQIIIGYFVAPISHKISTNTHHVILLYWCCSWI